MGQVLHNCATTTHAVRAGRVESIVSSDLNPVFLSTVEKNMPTHFPEVRHECVAADARELCGATLKSLLRATPDIVMGGPPCDDYTRLGRRRGFGGAKGPLIFDLLRIVDEMRPECFIFENVPNLTQQFKQTFQLFLDEANAIGFFSQWTLLKARDYGVPTQRTRVFVVGWKKSAMNDDFYFPDATHVDPKDCPLLVHPRGNLKPFRFVSNVLEGLPNVKTPEASGFFNHTGRNHRPETIEHIKTVPLGKQINKSFRYRAPWNGLSQSLTAGLDNSTKSQIHPHFHREMSVREYARLHLFPDSWVFSGTHHNGIKQVANSVPIPLGEAVLSAVIQVLDKKPI